MTIKVWYIENSDALYNALSKIIDKFACWVNSEPIEMNYLEVSVKARTEDIPAIERILAPLV